MPSPIRVVFDLDDTLYPEWTFAHGGFAAAGAWVLDNWGVDGVAARMRAMLDEGHLGGLFKAALKEYVPGSTEEDLANFIDIYRRHDPVINLFDDAAHALEHCATLGPMGLITDGTDFVQRSKVKALGIENRFASVIYTYSLGGRAFHKPHPKSFELTEQKLVGREEGVRLVYVGDNPGKDFVAPNQRGWTTVQVLRERTIHDTNVEPADGGVPHYRLESLYDLSDVLVGLD